MKVLYINFTGGEPLLRPEIFEILEYASDKKISIDLSTNGYLINTDIINRLKNTNIFNIQISIDGINETHDFLRGINGAFEKAINSINALKENGFNLIINTTINKMNVEQISEIINFCVKMGVTTFKTTLFIPTGRGQINRKNLILTKNDVQKAAIKLNEAEKVNKNKINIIKEGIYYNNIDSKIIEQNSFIAESNHAICSAGVNTIFLTASGNITPCPFLRNMVIGNITDELLSTMWKSKKFDIFRKINTTKYTGKCKDCDKLNIICKGGCRAAALAYNGDFYSEDPFCWI